MPDLYLVEFKGNRKEFFYNNFHHSLKDRDYVIIQVERGEDIGCVLQRVENEVDLPDDIRPSSILRPANDDDLIRLEDNRRAEDEAWDKSLKLIKKHGLEMKLVDIEFQFDRNKITFYFTAEHRVDFRALVRDLAAEHKTRIELRQIGVRDEAKRLGGLGICGLEQCCSRFLTGFDPISTQDARVQGLSLNPSKISGNCGRLLCCLKYEAEFYQEVRGKYPDVGEEIRHELLQGVVDRINVFEDYMVVTCKNGEEKKITGRELVKMGMARSPGPRPAPHIDDAESDQDETPKE